MLLVEPLPGEATPHAARAGEQGPSHKAQRCEHRCPGAEFQVAPGPGCPQGVSWGMGGLGVASETGAIDFATKEVGG